jgi:hypothetical protein
VTIAGSAQVPEGHRLALALTESATGAFEILDAQASSPQGGRITLRIKAAAFGLGDLVLPPLPWSLKAPDGTVETVFSPPVPLTVVPPESASKKGAEMLDIKGPLSPSAWPWILLTLALVCALLYPIHRRLRRKAPDGGSAPSEPPDMRTPDQKALDDLDALLGLDLPVKEFYDRLSDILRLYLSRRFGIDALQMTTSDLLRALRSSEAEAAGIRPLIKTLLDRCDLAKFARSEWPEPERRRDVESAKEIVRRAVRAPITREMSKAAGANWTGPAPKGGGR